MVVLTVILILLLVALLSDLGQGARDWVADLWNSLAAAGTESASLPHDAVDGADAAGTGAEGGTLARMLSSLPKDANGAVAAAAYRGQAAGAGQARRASGSGGPIGGAPAGAAQGVGTTGEPAASDGGAPPADGLDAPISALALADTLGGSGGGGAAASGGGEFGGGGPFSTVPGGPFVNLAPDGGNDGGPNGNPTSSVPEPGTLLLVVSAAVALGVRRYWRG